MPEVLYIAIVFFPSLISCLLLQQQLVSVVVRELCERPAQTCQVILDVSFKVLLEIRMGKIVLALTRLLPFQMRRPPSYLQPAAQVHFYRFQWCDTWRPGLAPFFEAPHSVLEQHLDPKDVLKISELLGYQKSDVRKICRPSRQESGCNDKKIAPFVLQLFDFATSTPKNALIAIPGARMWTHNPRRDTQFQRIS